LALVLALAALLLFAPVARADIEGGAHPYRDAVNPTPDGSDIVPLDDDDEGDDDEGDDEGGDDDDEDDEDDDEGSESDDDDEDDDEDDESSDDDDDSGDDDNGSDEGSDIDNPGDTEQGPTTSAVPGAAGTWLGLLLVAIAAIGLGTAYVLRQRRNQNR
jgi:hypothetical protein